MNKRRGRIEIMKNTMENPIDFVITWVDGQDKSWRRQRDSYSHTEGEDDSEVRYRDWGILRYWFRGVEQFAPWVGTIHFVYFNDDMFLLRPLKPTFFFMGENHVICWHFSQL